MCCRLLRQAGVDNVPSYSPKAEAEFTRDADKWWRECTGAPAFCDLIGKKFSKRVSTDGYAASVTTSRPLRQPVDTTQERRSKRKRGTTAATDSVNDINQQWVRGIEPEAIRQVASCTSAQQEGYLVALDPGRRSIFTAVEHTPPRACEQHLQDTSPPATSKYLSFSWSNKRWHEVSGTNEHKAKSAKWLQDAPAVEKALLETPSAKTANIQAFEQHIKHRLQHADAVLSHFSKPCHRKMKRKKKIRRQKALHEVCKTISRGSCNTIVGYGDARFSSSSKGLAPTPTSSLRRHLGRSCRVCDVDEFRTSMLCCACHRPMDGMPLRRHGEPPVMQQNSLNLIVDATVSSSPATRCHLSTLLHSRTDFVQFPVACHGLRCLGCTSSADTCTKSWSCAQTIPLAASPSRSVLQAETSLTPCDCVKPHSVLAWYGTGTSTPQSTCCT